MHMSKRTIAYVEGNSCRDVESIHFENNAALFEKAFALVCFVVLAETMYLCRTLGELLRMHSGCFCYRSNNVWFWKEQGFLYLLQKWHVNMSTPKKWRSQHPPPFFPMRISTLAVPRCFGSPRRWQWGIQWAWEGHGMENSPRKWRF